LHFTCRELALLSTVFVRRNEFASLPENRLEYDGAKCAS
jgi:hypothetical protein